MDSGFQHCLLCLLPLGFTQGWKHCCCTARPVPLNGLLARATNALEVEHGVRGGRGVTAALAVSGQTRIHWESSARGALRKISTHNQCSTSAAIGVPGAIRQVMKHPVGAGDQAWPAGEVSTQLMGGLDDEVFRVVALRRIVIGKVLLQSQEVLFQQVPAQHGERIGDERPEDERAQH